jgi:phosphoglycerate kinase
MNLKKIQDLDLTGKKVLLRVDFNVAVENGKAREKFKIAVCKETIDYILRSPGVKLALVSHLGRPTFTDAASFEGKTEGKLRGTVAEKFSLISIIPDISEILGVKVKFVPDCIGAAVKSALNNLGNGEILILENVRLYSGEEINDESFSRQLAGNFDIFINEAFSVSHRDQASVTGITKVLPSFCGLRFQKEIENLERVKNNPALPAIAIVGGAKIETKLPIIHMFQLKYDKVLVGGKIAIEAQMSGLSFNSQVILPLDWAEGKKDIGPKTIEKFKDIILGAKTIVWNGPMGRFEEPPYDAGTKSIVEAVIGSGAFTVVGGGESLQVLEENNLLDKISFVSTGGGAMLEYMSGNDLPGIEALKSS